MTYNDKFHRYLTRYINSGCLKRMEVLVSFFFPPLPFFLNACTVAKMFNRLKNMRERDRENFQFQEVSLEPYQCQYLYIEAIKNLIGTIKDDLYGAYIHGSLAMCEKIAYSDIDALIILKDDVFYCPKHLAKVAYKLNRALKYFYKTDPLQHHGWFVLTENDLKDYPQIYFPQELFKHTKSLFPDKGVNIKLYCDWGNQDYKTPFFDLALGIKTELESRCYPRNMYQLKGLLSRFMLLPTLYCQARDGKGVFKKYSFDSAKKDFSPSYWAIMDEVSEIRSNWNFSLGPLRRYFMTSRSPLWIRLKRKVGPRIPPSLKSRLTAGFYQRIFVLIEHMEKKLQ